MKAGPLVIIAGMVVLAGAGLLIYATETGTPLGIDVKNTEQVALGKSLYARECASCHGKNLQGQTRNWRQRLPDGNLPAPPHNASGHTWHHPDEMLFEITKFGRLLAAGRPAQSTMPAFENKLSDSEIWAVLSYIKSRWPDSIQQRHDDMNKRYRASR
jgi:mono/diheme cytochrome c family protein